MCSSNCTYPTLCIIHSSKINILYYLMLSFFVRIINVSYHFFIRVRSCYGCSYWSYFFYHLLGSQASSIACSLTGPLIHQIVFALLPRQWHISFIHIMHALSFGKPVLVHPDSRRVKTIIFFTNILCNTEAFYSCLYFE